MNPQQFVAKWSQIQQKETAVAQSHFNDVCALVVDPAGKDFSFETATAKPDGRKGFADVFYRGKFIWEYKGPHKDLETCCLRLAVWPQRRRDFRAVVGSESGKSASSGH